METGVHASENVCSKASVLRPSKKVNEAAPNGARPGRAGRRLAGSSQGRCHAESFTGTQPSILSRIEPAAAATGRNNSVIFDPSHLSDMGHSVEGERAVVGVSYDGA
ncbi:hypothetical protein GCM10023081_09250 [Arthrobacter ginkgonis]|uniref:Uncharacterized protein n=1 Tax=Arthrobacter ginkgonis TaxID=1630594 RepID=A0ABP7BXZ1_9MICC